MANQVKMAIKDAIIEYSRMGWSRRRIARTLGINRETVARYLGLAVSNPAIPPAGTGEANPAIPPAGDSGRISQCEPYKGRIEEALEEGLRVSIGFTRASE